uniref:probable lysine-specific demethylase ELF6 n=1 Tax=Erigeron canadensis TaxID=72917 RepID=UPI001CB8FFE2|nr:probable lysine-specific demethylase ELF6 [Erigeron canadensis]
MRETEIIPNWLKKLPLAPVFYPTDTEFADPIAYISKIEKQASAFGICKVVPPLPKPSKKYVFGNLNKSLLKCPELGNGVKLNNVGNVNNGEVRAVFTTRQQELGCGSGKGNKESGEGLCQPAMPVVNKQVWQSGEIYTLDQFESKSKTFARDQLGIGKEVSPLDVESRFWKAASEKPIYIEYANDVPGSGFGEPVDLSSFLRRHRRRRRFNRYSKDSSDTRDQLDNKTNSCDEQKGESIKCSSSSSVDMLKKDRRSQNNLSDPVPGKRGSDDGHEIEGSSGWKLSNCPWNLQVIARSPGSLTRFMPDDIPGVTSPMVYIGMLFSWFAWHVEDHELHSLNFLHIGAPKTWYAVPADYAYTFEEVIRSKAYGGGMDRLAALRLLGEKTTLLSPEIVVESGIPCCRLVQHPGEFVVTFPRAYHIGFSHGFNCGEAANFGTPEWLSLAKEAAVRRAVMNFLPMLSHQQLLYLLTMSFIPRVPRSLLPGIRSSRLKDRQREERELLVKKEFIEDMRKESNLLNSILQRNSSYRAVLWDLESLSPSVIREFDSMNIGNVHVNEDNDLDTETLRIEDEDMSSDFQIDSGTLPCVACGVLGYPFMSIMQPSEKAIPDTMPLMGHGAVQGHQAKTELVNGKDLSLDASTCSSKQNVEIGWNMSNGYLRPRIFCLEHAGKVEEMLESMGGAKLLILCHSDFQKIKAPASTIAEQIGSTFKYNEVHLCDATRGDLDLINLAIDNEQEDESVEDWTLKLNVNLRQSIRLRPKLAGGKIHAITMDALFSDPNPVSSVVSHTMVYQWQTTKSRSKRKVNSSINILSKVISKTKDEELKEKLFEAQIAKKEGRLIQYSRRRFRSKQHDSVIAIPEKTDIQREGQVIQEDSLLSHVEVLATPVVDDAKAHTFMDIEGVSVSCATTILSSENKGGDIYTEEICTQNDTSSVATKNYSVDEGNEDDLMQEGSGLTKFGGLSADKPVTDSSIRLEKGQTTDVKDEYKTISRLASGSKRKRELDLLQREEKCNLDGFIKSPCEGLRPRGGKDVHICKDEVFIMTKTIPEKPTKKANTSIVTEKSVKRSKASSVKFLDKDQQKSHKCDHEGCKMSFKTNTELSLHRKNRCPHEGCGKKFSTHRYAVIHLRVHEDNRPLKCTWKGCKMTFKWAWARTEHIRVHTGERPYKCKVDGCGLTFRFVSDFSRHRRKTGHNVHVKS